MPEEPKSENRAVTQPAWSPATRLDRVRFSTNVDMYRREHRATEASARRAVAEMLRRFGPKERALIGGWTISGFLHDLGIGNRHGRRASWDTIKRWRRELGCPIMRGKGPKAPAWTTDVLLRAWLVSLFSSDERGGPRVLKHNWSLPCRVERETVPRRASRAA